MNINNKVKAAVTCLFLLVLCVGCSTPERRADIQPVGRAPNIQPDYAGIVIPANNAPLNFFIKESNEVKE